MPYTIPDGTSLRDAMRGYVLHVLQKHQGDRQLVASELSCSYATVRAYELEDKARREVSRQLREGAD